jgi:adenosine deaminase
MEPTLRDRVLALPKAELHVHLLGAIPPDVLVECFNRHPPPDWLPGQKWLVRRFFRKQRHLRPFLERRRIATEHVPSLFAYRTFRQFLATYFFVSCLVREEADLRALVGGVVGALRAQNVVYAELTISPPGYRFNGISLPQIAACMAEAAERSDVRVQWIVDLVRDLGPRRTLRLLRRVLELDIPGVVGITLGGSEHKHPPHKFAEVYNLARDRGLRLTVHAGEARGPKSVWDALRILEAERIGHGIRSVEDPKLVSYLAEGGVPLEVCPTSNVRTGVVKSCEAHPVRALLDAGVQVSISSDDPTFFATTLTDEFVRLHEAGFTEGELLDLLRNGFRHAFLPEKDIAEYLDDFEGAVKGASHGT